MIARLAGQVIATGRDWALIDVGGVGFHVACSARSLARLSAGAPAVLFTELFIREEKPVLYGFAQEAERQWFRSLIAIQGVGAKVALSILSVADPDALALAIAAQDKAALTRADGVGAKLAARILAELKDRVADLTGGLPVQPGAAAAAQGGGAVADAISALVNLGYGRAEAHGAVLAASAALGADCGIDTLIRDGLRRLA